MVSSQTGADTLAAPQHGSSTVSEEGRYLVLLVAPRGVLTETVEQGQDGGSVPQDVLAAGGQLCVQT